MKTGKALVVLHLYRHTDMFENRAAAFPRFQASAVAVIILPASRGQTRPNGAATGKAE